MKSERVVIIAALYAAFLVSALIGYFTGFVWLGALGFILSGVVLMGAGFTWLGLVVHREWYWRKRQKSRDRAYAAIRDYYE